MSAHSDAARQLEEASDLVVHRTQLLATDWAA